MNRLVSSEYSEMIGRALYVLPDNLRARLRHVNFLTGTDPIYAGLHHYTQTAAGDSYLDVFSTAFRCHTSDRSTTIILPYVNNPVYVFHELGHALDETLGWSHTAAPVSEYAKTDRTEAFAEAFTAWQYWYGDQDALYGDEATVRLFEDLSEIECPNGPHALLANNGWNYG